MSQLLLDRLCELACQDAKLGPWLSGAVRRWQRGEVDTLEAALGVSREDAMRARNAALRDAAALIAAEEPSLSAWAIAGTLAKEIKRYDSIVEPRLRRDPAASLSQIMERVHEAMTQRCRPLRCREAIYKLLAN